MKAKNDMITEPSQVVINRLLKLGYKKHDDWIIGFDKDGPRHWYAAYFEKDGQDYLVTAAALTGYWVIEICSSYAFLTVLDEKAE